MPRELTKEELHELLTKKERLTDEEIDNILNSVYED